MENSVQDLPNISDYRDLTNIPYLLAGILFIDVLVLFLVRYKGVGGKSLNGWYDNFGLEGVIADVFIILIGFVIGQYVYTHYVAPTYGWSPFLFVSLVVLIQVIHDIAFYYGVILQIPKGHNMMMDMYKFYAEENGGLIIGGDALLMIGSALATFALKSMPDYAAMAVTILTVYTLPYILNTKPQYMEKIVAQSSNVSTKDT